MSRHNIIDHHTINTINNNNNDNHNTNTNNNHDNVIIFIINHNNDKPPEEVRLVWDEGGQMESIHGEFRRLMDVEAS